MKIRRRRPVKNLVAFIIVVAVTFAVFLLLLSFDKQLRKILEPYSVSTAKRIIVAATDAAVLEVLKDNEISYEKIANLSTDSGGNVTSLQIDTTLINILKSNISNKLTQQLNSREDYVLKIPIGTIIGNEFTVGRGPSISFKMKLSAAVKTDFKSNFYNAGINQVLHQILIEVKYDGFILIPWFRESFSDKTDYIAAQTVIVGVVPDAFTNVIESEPEQITGDIFDFSAERGSGTQKKY